LGSLLVITHGFLQLYGGSIAFAIPKSDSNEAEIKLTTFLNGLASQHSRNVNRKDGHFLIELARFSHFVFYTFYFGSRNPRPYPLICLALKRHGKRSSGFSMVCSLDDRRGSLWAEKKIRMIL
jgi:hypothetical protein